MSTESLINGLIDICTGRLSPEAIIDMAPEIVEKLQILMLDKISPKSNGVNNTYICGKVTGLDFMEVQRNFYDAEHRLRSAGYTVVNPIRIVDQNQPWDAAMRICIAEMANSCNKIYNLHNYMDSRGATIENYIANALEFKKIKFSDTLKRKAI